MKFHVYKSRNCEWRWRLVARNGRIVAESGEGYKSRAHILKMIAKVVTLPFDTPVVQDA
jgi:uncharacterized protein YegP (UPF0339 family)